MAPTSSFGSLAMRMTETHIFFWGSFLSNWDQSHNFSGARALEILLPRLDDLWIVHPSKDDASTEFIAKHNFNCGEQFMMACKAWLFDADSKNTMLKAILASKKPMEQKALGRKVAGFIDTIWTPASVHIVVSSQLARAEVDQRLAKLYHSSGQRKFVEGSPRDSIWGVGIHWKEKAIEDEKNWTGENRLGRCHDLAREALRKQETANLATRLPQERNETEIPVKDAIIQSSTTDESVEDRKINSKDIEDHENGKVEGVKVGPVSSLLLQNTDTCRCPAPHYFTARETSCGCLSI